MPVSTKDGDPGEAINFKRRDYFYTRKSIKAYWERWDGGEEDGGGGGLVHLSLVALMHKHMPSSHFTPAYRTSQLL